MWSKHLLIFLESLQWSSVIFENLGNLLKFSEIFVPKRSCGMAFCQFSEDLWKSLKSGQEFSGNCQKCGYQYDYIKNKVINGCKLVDMEYLFSCSALYLTLKILSWTLKEIHVFYIILCIYLPMYYTLSHSIKFMNSLIT